MNTLTSTETKTSPTIDFAALKARQQGAWATGDYAVVGTSLQIVGESLCEALDLRAGSNVLDVAAGNGNATLAAARRGCDVVSTDYVPSLLEAGSRRADAEGAVVRFQEADAEDLPFPDATFDVVLSTFGVMFTPDHERATAEMVRVCKPGGSIGLANWTPDGFVGRMFQTIGRYAPPPAGTKPPARWGTHQGLAELFAGRVASIAATPRHFHFRYRSPEHWLQVFRDLYGPLNKTFGALDAAGREALASDLLVLVNGLNRSGDGTLVVPGEYLEVVIER